MDRVAAKIAKETSVFLQDGDLNACAREQVAGHHSRRSAADDHAAGPDLGQRAHEFDV